MSHAPKLTPEQHAETRTKMQAAFEDALANFDKFGHGVAILSIQELEEQSNEVCKDCGEVHPQTGTAISVIGATLTDTLDMALSMVSAVVEQTEDPMHAMIAAKIISEHAKEAARDKLNSQENPLAALMAIMASRREAYREHADEVKPTETPATPQ